MNSKKFSEESIVFMIDDAASQSFPSHLAPSRSKFWIGLPSR